MTNIKALNRYYRRRKIDPPDYDAYWLTSVDPDGKTRNRREERDQYLKDLTDEVEWLNSLEPGVALDVGCGFGWLLSALPDGWTKYGLEVSRKTLAVAKSVVPDGRFILWSEDMAGINEDSVDLIICHHVIEHAGSPCSLMNHLINPITHKGSRLLMATPDFESPCAKRFGERYRMLHDKTHCSLFSNESMHRFLSGHGWQIDRVEYPFPERYATPETFARWNDTEGVSPPWPGNWMTFYCTKS